MRRPAVVAAATLALVSVTGTASAAKPTPAPAAITVDQPGPHVVGDVITYTTTGEARGSAYLMVGTACFQDVNGDGTVSTVVNGPDVVFTSLREPGEPHVLGGATSIWTLRGGGPATCRGDLIVIDWKGGRQSADILASVAFAAA